ncbi:MAG: TIGR04282 family arsenosugar biosynthesis glycosyltransferase [Verrucomicrobiota bacterium]
MSNAILIFVKYPEPGRVKTRLAATLGPVEATAIYRALVAEVCGRLPASDSLVVLFDPSEREMEVREWIGEYLPPERTVQFWPQGEGDLGARLTRAFESAFTHGFHKVAVIGSDCVEMDAAIFSEAWEALETLEGAIGPTEDGGYYLMALRHPAPLLFSGIEWSTEAVFQQTLQRAAEAGMHFHQLPRLRDVDTEEDWRQLRSRITEASPKFSMPER